MWRFFLKEWCVNVFLAGLLLIMFVALLYAIVDWDNGQKAKTKKCVAQVEEAYQSISNLCTIEPECHKQLLRLQAESIRNCYRKH